MADKATPTGAAFLSSFSEHHVFKLVNVSISYLRSITNGINHILVKHCFYIKSEVLRFHLAVFKPQTNTVSL